jgi:hypothetical protein
MSERVIWWSSFLHSRAVTRAADRERVGHGQRSWVAMLIAPQSRDIDLRIDEPPSVKRLGLVVMARCRHRRSALRRDCAGAEGHVAGVRRPQQSIAWRIAADAASRRPLLESRRLPARKIYCRLPLR